MTKTNLRNKAIVLRTQGYSYNLIRKQIFVSKSTLSIWLKDVAFSPNKEVQNRVRAASLCLTEWVRKDKQHSIEIARKHAQEKLGLLSARDLFMLGLGLYMGEGTKSHEIVRVINADPRIIALAIRWFEECFGLTAENFSITLHIYPDNDIAKSVNFWSNVTGIPKAQFGKIQIDERKKTLKKRGMLRYGTAHLYISSRGQKKFGRLLFRTIIALIEGAYKQID